MSSINMAVISLLVSLIVLSMVSLSVERSLPDSAELERHDMQKREVAVGK